jgi:hypothetical protein
MKKFRVVNSFIENVGLRDLEVMANGAWEAFPAATTAAYTVWRSPQIQGANGFYWSATQSGADTLISVANTGKYPR